MAITGCGQRELRVGDRVRSRQPDFEYTGIITHIDSEDANVDRDGDDGWSCKIVGNRIATANGRWDGESYLELEKIINKKPIMQKLNVMMKKLLDADTQTLVKACYIDGDLELTEEGKDALLATVFDTNKAALVALATAKLAEETKKSQ